MAACGGGGSPQGESQAPAAGVLDKIAFTSTIRDGDPEIYVINTDGTEETRITDHPGLDAYPAWSPDGTKIAFSSKRNGGIDIYTMNPDGSEVQRLLEHRGSDTYPAWSPDGTKITFVNGEVGSTDIYVINAVRAPQADR